MVDNERIRNAEKAVRWAKRQSFQNPDTSNFEMLQHAVKWRLKNGGLDLHALALSFEESGYCPVYWACLSRLMTMGDPKLARDLHYSYIEDLDNQVGVAFLCLHYRSITGEPPAVRSWKIAKQEQEAVI